MAARLESGLFGMPAPRVPESTGSPGPVVPRSPGPGLPGAVVSHFAGRDDELAALTGLLERADRRAPATAVISAVGGMAGVGKTALAVHWARLAGPRFPDGQLYVNLRGYDLGSPMPPEDALAGFLRSLGVPGQEIPAGMDERAARYRSMLAGRRMLVLLDNARSAEQVRPLLPATASCMTVVTSRDALAGLVIRDGAQVIELDLLPPADAARLLQTLIGERAAADPGAARALAERCSRLPLALRVAAACVAARPGACLGSLVAELTDERRRLDLPETGGDPRTAMRAVFSWSYRQLEQTVARAFRLVALHPGPDLDVHAVAALIGGTPGQAAQLLGRLVRAHLIQPSGSSPNPAGRYTRHDLLRGYGRELAAATDAQEERRAALTRLFDYYLYAAAAAAAYRYPADRSRYPVIPGPDTPVPPVSAPAAAVAWLDAERASLVAIAVHAARNGWPHHATRLAAILSRYLDTGGYVPEGIALHNAARRAARRVRDRGAEAEALASLGRTDLRQGRYQQAVGRFQKAQALFRAIGHRSGEARALGNLGVVAMRQGRYQQAADYQRQALIIFRAIGDKYQQARAHNGLGRACHALGDLGQARRQWQQALALYTRLGAPEADRISGQLARMAATAAMAGS